MGEKTFIKKNLKYDDSILFRSILSEVIVSYCNYIFNVRN